MPFLRRLFAAFAVLIILTSVSYADTRGRVKLLQTGQVNTATEKALLDEDFQKYLLYPPHDDGDLQMGLKWTASKRFKDNGDGTITDTLTGLMWLQDASLHVSVGWPLDAAGLGGLKGGWNDAVKLVDLINTSSSHASYNGGYTDWRLPNIVELESITTADRSCSSMLKTGYFLNPMINKLYVSSTTAASDPASVWCVNMNCGKVIMSKKAQSGLYLLPVRGHTNGVAQLWRTGSFPTYNAAANDDGALQEGVAWPDPRFVDNGDGTVADRLTGLYWAKDTGTPAFGGHNAGTKSWIEALDYIDALNAGKYLGHGDWRMPNRKELFSLVDFSQSNPAMPTGHPFLNFKYGGSSGYYWSSSTHYSHTNEAFHINFISGEAPFYWKVPRVNTSDPLQILPAPKYYVWPVRGDSAAADPFAPVSRITSPSDGSYLPGPFGTYNITGTAGGGEGGLNGVCVSTDGGATWQPATDTSSGGTWSSWSYPWTPAAPGKYIIKSKAVDKQGYEEAAGAGITLYAGIYRLSVSVTPSGGGSVALDPPGGTYDEGESVSLTADPSPKFIFTGWSGGLTGTQNPAEVMMDKSKTVVANFASPDYHLTVNVTPPEGGSVSVSPQGAHKPGDVISLNAVPAEGYIFGGWDGNVADKTSASTTIVMNGDETVMAEFRKKKGVTLKMSQEGQSVLLKVELYDEGGQVSGKPVKFLISTDGGGLWAEKGKAATGSDGACLKALKLPAGSYKLKAACMSADGQIYETGVMDVTIAQVQLLSPAPGAVVNESAPAVSWTPIPSATGYEVKVKTGKTVLGTVNAAADAASANLPPLPKGRRAKWSVTAVLTAGKSMPSVPRDVIYKESAALSGLDAALSGSMAGPSATLTGNDSGPLAGKKVRFFIKNSSGMWALFGLAVTDASGKAQMLPKTVKPGAYSLKAVFRGDAGLAGAESGEAAINIP